MKTAEPILGVGPPLEHDALVVVLGDGEQRSVKRETSPKAENRSERLHLKPVVESVDFTLECAKKKNISTISAVSKVMAVPVEARV